MSAPLITLTLSVDETNLVLMGLQAMTQGVVTKVQSQAKQCVDEFNASMPQPELAPADASAGGLPA